MKPIVFDGSCLGGARPSGVERAFLRTLEAFRACRRETPIILFVPHDLHRSIRTAERVPDSDRELAIDAAITVRVIPRLPLALWREKFLCRELRRLDARALWTPTTALPPDAPCPTIATVHELPTRMPAAEDPPLRALRQERARRALASRASYVVVPSQTTARDLARENPQLAERIRVVPQPLGPEMLEAARTPKPIEEQRDRNGLVFIGLGRRRKNLACIAHAWRLLPSDVRAKQSLTWIGSASKMPARLQTAGLVGTETVSSLELVAVIRSSRGLILASRSEGFGIPALEALACGRPPLVARSSAPAEHCKDLAATCDPYDARSIARGMLRLLEDEELAERASTRGPETASRFDAASTARAWFVILSEASS